MAELLLVNPRKRARRASTKARKRRSRRRNPIANLGAYVKRRRTVSRGISGLSRRRRVHRRRRNPIGLSGLARRRVYSRRRRRNPIMGGGLVRNFMTMVKDAGVGAAGAVAVDIAMGQVNRFLPASLQRVPGKVGVGDAVKAAITVVLAKVLSRPTRGLSVKMGQGALTVQMHSILAGFVPPTLQLGYLVPGRVVDATARVGPMQVRQGMNAYVRAGTPSPLLSAYTRPGVTPLLSGARKREGAVR